MTDKEIIASVGTDEEDVNETPAEVNEQPAEPSQTNEQAPSETVSTNDTPTPPVSPVENKPNDLSELEKARYSFQRQYGKQKDRYESKLKEWEKKYQALEKRLGAIENPAKPITREQFETDDQMIDAIVQQRFDKMWSAKQEEMQEQYEKYLEEQRQEEEHKRELDDGIKHWFPTEEERNKYVTTVQNAYNNGLAELLEQERNVLDFLHSTQNSSLILMEFATNPKVVNEIFSLRNPLQRLMAVHDLERDLVAKKNAPQPVPTTEPPAATPTPVTETKVNNLSKSIGKPGTAVEAEPDIFANEDSLLDFIRRV